MNILVTFFSTVFLYGTSIVFGYCLSQIIGIKDKLERLGIGILVSTHLVTYLSFLLYAYLNVRYTFINQFIIFVFMFIFSSIFLYFSYQKSKPDFSKVIPSIFNEIKKTLIQYDRLLLIIILLLPIAFTFFQNIHWPVVDWDAVALYDYRAKVFTISGGMEDGIERGYFLHYPLYTSLLHTYTYLFGLSAVRIWYTLMYVASLAIFYRLLRRSMAVNRALLGTFIFSISPRILQHAQMTYTNLPHAIFLSFGYIYLWEWIRIGKKVDLFIATLMIAGSMWVRITEPLWLPAITLYIIGIWKHKKQWRFAISSIVLIFILRQPWVNFVKYYDKLDIVNPLQIGLGYQLPSNITTYFIRLQEVQKFFSNGVFPLIKGYVPPIIITTIYALYKEKWSNVFESVFFFVLVLFIYVGILLFSFQFDGWKDIPDSAARMTMFLLPLAVYIIMKSDLWNLQKKLK